MLLFGFHAKLEIHQSGSGWHVPSASSKPWLDHQKMEASSIAGPALSVCVLIFLISFIVPPPITLGRMVPFEVKAYRAELFHFCRYLRPPPGC